MAKYSRLSKRALLVSVSRKLDRVLGMLAEAATVEEGTEMNLDELKASFETLKADVATKESVDESAKTLLTSLAAIVREAVGNATDLATLKDSMTALATQIEGDTEAMSASVTENTVAA